MSSTTVYVLTRNKRPSWSRYVLPFDVEAFAQLGNALYVKDHAGVVHKIVEGIVYDEDNGGNSFYAIEIRWNYLDLGQPGVSKMLEGFDIVTTHESVPHVAVKFGYDQRVPTSFTTQVFLAASDTVPGNPYPYPITLPTFSPHVRLTPSIPVTFYTMTLYLHDNAPVTQ